VTTNQSSSEESPDSGEAPDSEASSGMMDSSESDESESNDAGKLDVAPVDDMPAGLCSVLQLAEDQLAATYPDCEINDVPLGANYYEVCIDPPADDDCSSICPPEMLCTGMELCVAAPWYGLCGPYQTNGMCCLVVADDEPPVPGRPFLVAGAARLASVADSPCDRVAAHWLEVARGEHASIAAFARFVAVLQKFGAPARLIADAIAAAADEVRHAEQTLALAANSCGRQLEFGPLAVTDAMRDTDDLAAALRAAVLEGCIEETLAAHEAACMAANAEEPHVASVLERIAADEARHATLAWRFVEWAVWQRPQLRSVVVEAFASIAEPRAYWRRVGLREVVVPCAGQLLNETKPPARSAALAPCRTTPPRGTRAPTCRA
jgi:rubrerythrin